MEIRISIWLEWIVTLSIDYKSVFDLIKQGRRERENNTLTLQMLADAMRMLGLNPKEEELQEIINTIEIEGTWLHFERKH